MSMKSGPWQSLSPRLLAASLALGALATAIPACRTRSDSDQGLAQASSKVPGTPAEESPGKVPGTDTGKVPGTAMPTAVAGQVSGTAAGKGETTPRLSVPEVAEQLTDAFANAAKAIRPSVVRIDVEMAAGARRGMARDESPGPDVPDFL